MAIKLSKSTIQSLEKQHGSLFYPKAAFEPTVNQWNGIPVLYGKRHVDQDLFETSPQEAMDNAECHIVGSLSDARIENDLLCASVNISDDIAEQDYIKGLLSGSTGLKAHTRAGVVEFVVAPSHFLLFNKAWGTPKDEMVALSNCDVANVTNSEDVIIGLGNFDIIEGIWRDAPLPKPRTVGTFDMIAGTWMEE